MPQSESHAAEQRTDATAPGQYAPVNGLELYYEIHGRGAPLILLHGGFAASESLGENLSELAKGRQVIAVHLQGHGRTRDIERPLRLESMADDIAALIRHLGLDQADVMGYSLGGGVALQTAIRHPALVRKLVVVSAAMRRDGSYPEVLAAFEAMTANAAQIGANVKNEPIAELYPHIDWVALFTKIGELLPRDYDWSVDVERLAMPVMLVFADADSVRPEHIIEFYKLLGGGQRDPGFDTSQRPVARLAIVPGATHYNILSTTIVAQLVAPFLDEPLPAASSA